MPDESRNRVRRATVVFWVLLVYIIAALAWWAYSLEMQNRAMYNLRKAQIDTHSAPADYKKQLVVIAAKKRRSTIKYICEGFIFLLFIIIGAVFIYRSVRRQFQLQQQQQNFVMAVTHELKTPVSVARLNLETLQRHNLDGPRKEKLMQISLQETLRLDTLINNILISAQLDGGAYEAAKEELSFSHLVLDVLTGFHNRYPDREVVQRVDEGIDLKGDALLLKLLLSNLLENANKYSGRKSAITCTLQQPDDAVLLTVQDKGIGINENEKKKIWTKFYRIGDEQTRKTKGTGLGLYICKKIADHHHATIAVTDNIPVGSIFSVTFFRP